MMYDACSRHLSGLLVTTKNTSQCLKWMDVFHKNVNNHTENLLKSISSWKLPSVVDDDTFCHNNIFTPIVSIDIHLPPTTAVNQAIKQTIDMLFNHTISLYCQQLDTSYTSADSHIIGDCTIDT